MADLLVTDITNIDKNGIFDVLMGAVNEHVNSQYQNNRITGSDFANVYLSSIQYVLQAAVQYGLQEKLTEAQIDGIIADNLLKTRQLDIAEQELALKLTEANRLRDTTEAELEKQWGYEVTRDSNGDLVLGPPSGTGRIDKEIEKMQADIDISSEQIEIAKAQASKEYVTMLASLDKELGYDYTLDSNGEVIRSSISDAGDGKLDKEVEKMTADIELVTQQIEIAKSTNALERGKAKATIDKEYGLTVTEDVNGNLIIGADTADGKIDAEIAKMTADAEVAQEQVKLARASLALEQAKAVVTMSKEYGYDVTSNVDGNIVLGSDQGDGRVDFEIANLTKQGILLDAQAKTSYADRVLKDKQAAKLGLDNVMKLAEAERVSDPNTVYTPKYEEL